jgi:ribosomal protein S18 acetylase RimI-like enzyme
MAFQDFKYVVQEIIGYVEYYRTVENDLSHVVKISPDEYGHIISIETELSYRNNKYLQRRYLLFYTEERH